MHRNLSGERLGVVMALTLVFGTAAGAGDLEWKDRGDRWEGIRGKDTSGGFEFLGVYAEPGTRKRGAEKLWLSVPLSRAAEMQVTVWEPASGYAMVPKQESFGGGAAFSWRRAGVLAPAGIEADQLYVRASHPEENLYYPARLTTADPPGEVSRYVFRFRSGGGVELEVTIAREEEDKRLVEVVMRRRDEDLGGVLDFVWDVRGAGGRAQPPGVYHLKLKGTVFARTDEPQDVDIPFVHDLAAAP